MNILSSDTIFVLGDSIVSGFGVSQPLQTGFLSGIRAAYGSPNCPPVTAPFMPNPRWPKNIGCNGAAGRKTVDISAGMAALLAPYQPATAVFVVLSASDGGNIALGAGGVPPETANNTGTSANDFGLATLAIVDALHSIWGLPYNKICWLGPMAFTTILPQVAQMDTNLALNAATRGFQYLKLSQIAYPVGLTIGDNVHPNLAGVTAMTPAIMAGLTFS